MECTGERYLPNHDGDWTLEHVHRYLMACELAKDKDVLDIASGEGYGSYMLAGVARRVTGVDIDLETLALAKNKYYADNLEYLQGSATKIPLPDNSVDVVSSFETIEHLAEHAAMLSDIKRVLRPGGLLIISSPDKHEYTDIPGYHNTYHVKELYRHEFESLLSTYFAYHCVYGQRVVFGSVVGAEGNTSFVSWNKSALNTRTVGLSQAEYLVAVASDRPVPALPSGILKTPLSESDTVRRFEEQSKEMSDAISYLERVWQESKLKLQENEEYSQEIRLKLQESEQRRAKAEQDLFAILHSRSWKLTRPLRALMALGHCLGFHDTHNSPKPSSIVAQVAAGWPSDVRSLRVDEDFSDIQASVNAPSIGVFVHMYYPELADDVAACLKNLPPSALHVSTDTVEKERLLQECFAGHGLEADIRVCPNKGWDIAPFLVGFSDVIPQYELLLRLHSKRSPHIAGQLGDHWRNMLYSSLAGSPERVSAILRAFEVHANLGMVAPPLVEHYAHAVHFGGNFLQMHALLAEHGIHVSPETPIDFPMGSMFWCRPQVLQPWLDHCFSYDDFEPQHADKRDSSLAHALERLFFFGCGISGKRWARLPK